MANYRKPVVSALSMESERSGCNFFITDSGEGVFIYTEGGIFPGGGSAGLPGPIGSVPTPGEIRPGAIAENNVAHVGDGGASVTPLANTGLPGTQPIIIGVPASTSGVNANVGPSGSNTSASVSTADLGLTVLGIQVLPL